MKHFIFFIAIAFAGSTSLMAQHQNHQEHRKNQEKLSQEQRTELRTKQMQLALDLSENQAKQVAQILKKYPRPARSQKKDELSTDERYEMHLKNLDQQIALQKEMKNVLNEQQYESWKKMQHPKKGRMAHQGRGPKSPQKPMHPGGVKRMSSPQQKQF